MKRIFPFLLIFVLTALAAIAALASGQGIAPTMNQDGVSIPFWLNGIVGTVLTSLAAMGTALLNEGRAWFKARAKDIKINAIQSALLTLEELAGSKVVELYNSSIEAIKAASADGKLTVEEIRAVMDTAISELSGSLPDWVRKVLLNSVNGSPTQFEDGILKPAIELAIQNNKDRA